MIKHMKFTKTNVVGLILAVCALFPALDQHTALLQQILTGGLSGVLLMGDYLVQLWKHRDDKAAEEAEKQLFETIEKKAE